MTRRERRKEDERKRKSKFPLSVIVILRFPSSNSSRDLTDHFFTHSKLSPLSFLIFIPEFLLFSSVRPWFLDTEQRMKEEQSNVRFGNGRSNEWRRNSFQDFEKNAFRHFFICSKITQSMIFVPFLSLFFTLDLLFYAFSFHSSLSSSFLLLTIFHFLIRSSFFQVS